MYTIYLSVIIAVVISFIPTLFGVSMTWTAIPGILMGVLAFVWINRRVGKRLEAVTKSADAEIAQLQQITSRQATSASQAKQIREAAAAKIDQAVQRLETGFIFQKWQIGIGSMLNARIGTLLFTRWAMLEAGDVKDAIPYLERSQVKGRKAQLLGGLWPAWTMLAVAHYKGNNDTASAVRVFEDTVGIAKKEGLLWSVYAWVLWKEKRIDDAIDVLARGQVAAPNDARLTENLSDLQNGKKLNMRGYGEQWYQFGLERPRVANTRNQQQQQRMGHPRARGRGNRRR
jgi:predicted Zn-dependent protease